jgi:CubicO group peptidase (beta-lactamase class C family)
LSRPPTVAPSYTPSYSNAAFTILGYALESITGLSLPNLLTSPLIDPLGLNATSYAQPPSADMAIVPFDHITSSYSADQFERAVGTGYYSSLNDMTRIGLSILNSTFLTPAQTRRWLKPNAFRSNVNDSVGASWEIFRAPGERVSYLYTKAGLLGSYPSQLALMPDYNVGFTVLAAGKAGLPQVQVLSNMLAEIFYPASKPLQKRKPMLITQALPKILPASIPPSQS